MWIDTNEQFAAFCKEIEPCETLGIDLEFQGEGRYTPQLCLVQLATVKHLVAVDPFKVNLAPLVPLLSSERIGKVFHAGMQDIAILRRETGSALVSVFDTQVAAAFLGFGDSIGYVPLVARTLHVSLDKRQRFTDWTQRPLSEAQIGYALNDVRHLLQLADILMRGLQERARLQWAREACAEMVDEVIRLRLPETAYLRFGKLAGMSRRELAVLRELAAWREMTARVENRPVNSILNEDVLRQLCFALPRNDSDLRKVRGLRDGLPRQVREELLAAIHRGLSLSEDQLPTVITPRESDASAEAIASLLGVVVRARSAALEIAPTLLAIRDDLVRLALWKTSSRQGSPPNVDVLHGWRAEAVGNLLLEVLDGKIVVRVDHTLGGISLEKIKKN